MGNVFGKFCNIDKDVVIGRNVVVGNYVTLKGKTIIGDNVVIKDYSCIEDSIINNNSKIGCRATLKFGTYIGVSTTFDDHCITTGACYIGNNVNIRTGAIVSKAVIISDYSFIGPGVITNHTKHVAYGRDNIDDVQLLTIINSGVIIGSQCSLLAGVNIGKNTIVGAASLVRKDLDANSVYVGNPLVRYSDIPSNYYINDNLIEEVNIQKIYNQLKQYIPNLKNVQYGSD